MLFEAKTHEGHMIKILAEVLQNSIRAASFDIYQDKITMRMIDDSQRRILIDLSLEADNFNIYRLNSPEKIRIGITMSHLYRIIKNVKKNDVLHIYIEDDDRSKLYLKVFPKNMSRYSKSFIPIQTIQSLDIPIPTGYSHPIIITSNEFQKTLKELCSLSPHLVVKMTEYNITLVSVSNDIIGKTIAFGDHDADDTDEKFNDTFVSEQLNRIYKMAGLSSCVKVYGDGNLPLLVKTNVGNLGQLQIFIRSKSQIEQDEIHLSSNSLTGMH